MRNWCLEGDEELLQATQPHIAQLRSIAMQTYGAWTEQLERSAAVAVPVQYAIGYG